MATPISIDKLIKEDHARMRRLNHLYWHSPTAEMRQHIGYLAVHHWSKHASQEEVALYPAIGRVFGEATRQQHLKEDYEQRRIMARLGSMSAYRDLQAYDAQFRLLMEDAETHMQREEQVILPALARDNAVDLVELGRAYERAEMFATTRPHLWSPMTPPLDIVAKLMLAPLDWAADFVRFAGYVPPISPHPAAEERLRAVGEPARAGATAVAAH